jgi:hypothetical protein
MNDPIDANFAALSEPSAVKDGSTCGNEDFIFDGAAYNVSVRANEAIIAEFERVAGVAAENRVLHDDALIANFDGTTFRDDLRTEKNPAARANGNIAANNGVGRNIGGRVNLWRSAFVRDEHGKT